MNPQKAESLSLDLKVEKTFLTKTKIRIDSDRASHGRPLHTKPLRLDHASARFMLLIASSISCVFLNPIVAQSTPAFWKANLIAFTRSS
jgi:hypothetical protein